MTERDQVIQEDKQPDAEVDPVTEGGPAPAAATPPGTGSAAAAGVPADDDVAGPQGDPLAGALSPAEEAGRSAAAADEEPDVDQLRSRAAERDQYLALAQRAQADFENYRRRAGREAAQAQERGAGRLAKELLPALDHLELALKAAEAEGGELFKGVRMVQEEMLGALGRVGIQPFAPAGEPFDPNEHEAMVQRPVEGAEPGTVVEVYQQGYRINGVVLRPARVVVAA
jgi:molecular chaperone GrpE